MRLIRRDGNHCTSSHHGRTLALFMSRRDDNSSSSSEQESEEAQDPLGAQQKAGKKRRSNNKVNPIKGSNFRRRASVVNDELSLALSVEEIERRENQVFDAHERHMWRFNWTQARWNMGVLFVFVIIFGKVNIQIMPRHANIFCLTNTTPSILSPVTYSFCSFGSKFRRRRCTPSGAQTAP